MSPAAATEAGLMPLGALTALVAEDRTSLQGTSRSGDVSALVIKVSMREEGQAHSDARVYVLGQASFRNSALTTGSFRTQVSVFAKVLKHEGNILFHFGGRGSPRVTISGGGDSDEWRHYYASQIGFGGLEQSFFAGAGSMTVALALPYIGTGDHGGVPVWAASESDL